jgi:hypothetical protein
MKATALALLVAASCAPPPPDHLVRIAGAEPAGDAAPADGAAAVWFTGPVDGEEILGGRRIVLVRIEDVRAAAEGVESEDGAAGPPAIPAAVSLEEGGVRALLRPLSPLAAGCGHALVVSSHLRATDGRPVLDPDGRRRVFVHAFSVAPPQGPAPVPALTEVRADADSPEAGGEYVEVANLGEGPLDLRTFRLAKRTASGALSECVPWPLSGGPVPPGGHALLVGGAYDQRYALPASTALYACGGAALLGGLANDRPPDLLLLDRDASAVSTVGESTVAPRCTAALERIHPAGPDAPENWVCGDGTPGACNASTQATECP